MKGFSKSKIHLVKTVLHNTDKSVCQFTEYLNYFFSYYYYYYYSYSPLSVKILNNDLFQISFNSSEYINVSIFLVVTPSLMGVKVFHRLSVKELSDAATFTVN
jgi:hypothetical protein